ncbi:MAG: methylated-DNA--[protein]-cysteine S-methyltransferase [Defluviitaleaceae bacterium]|nr:methylated-DNA--[protein]-cysteine S-methyltransferase [Defluviitaleaceae bacterium]
MMYKWTYETEVGVVTIGANKHSITYLKLHDTSIGAFKETVLIRQAYLQLEAYLRGECRNFDLPFEPGGTEFQKQVWHVVSTIPYGETMTYKAIAQMINKPKAIRAVGAANGQNPIYMVIPCHRVIGSNGHLTGYGGGLEMKERLLKLEGADINGSYKN